ncbi:MAG: amino acid carrier protein [Holosporales bacterium]|jgi:AGCS family alanine or glycine:cation symporter|nr:amino acid carrier protein [Holosporales bacterium]
MTQVLNIINDLLWGAPLILLLLGTGLYFTFKLRNLKFFNFKLGVRYIFAKEARGSKGDISSFAALCTALSATLGTGNIVGVAVAISIGGPGVIFWLWVSSLLCFSIKYAEAFLAIKYRVTSSTDKVFGGPMYYLETGLKSKVLARLYALFGIFVAVFGIGTLAQGNSIVAALESFGIPSIATIIALGIIVILVTIGGLERISQVAKQIVPAMSLFYIGAALIVLILRIDMIPHAFRSIFLGAFSPQAILGGGVGVSFINVIHIGVSRGIYAHESGLGSAAIASAAAKTNSPEQQGLIAMIGAFLTVVVCTMTGLVLLVNSDSIVLFNSSISGSLLTPLAFDVGLRVPELGKCIVNISIVFFAFTTILGWNFYGERCTKYLLGDRWIIFYKFVFILALVTGPFLNIDIIFIIADIVIGLMTIPNIIGIIRLRKSIYLSNPT